jgi:hypothetical protein
MSSPLPPLSFLLQPISPQRPNHSNNVMDPDSQPVVPQAGSPIDDLVIVSLPGSPAPALPPKSVTASTISLRENPSEENSLNEAELKACKMASEFFKNLFESDSPLPQKEREAFTKKFNATVELGSILTTAKLSPDIYHRCLELLQLYQTHRDQGRASLANSILNLVIENAKQIQNSYMQCTVLLKINHIQQSLTDSLPSTHPDKERLKAELISIANDLKSALAPKKDQVSPYLKCLKIIEKSKEYEEDAEISQSLLEQAALVAADEISDCSQQYQALLQISEAHLERKNFTHAWLLAKFVSEKVSLIGDKQLISPVIEKTTQLLERIKAARKQ